MAKLYYRYGAMNSGKSFEVLKVAHNYEEQGKAVAVFTSAIDDRVKVGTISSRVGFNREVTPVDDTTNIYDIVNQLSDKPYCVLLDEAQFLSKKHILQLVDIVDQLNIPVIAFGLKNDFANRLFEGSEMLLLYADSIEEIKTICWFCNRKATMNLRIHNQKPVYSGEQIEIGGNESYIPTCRACYHQPPLSQLKNL